MIATHSSSEHLVPLQQHTRLHAQTHTHTHVNYILNLLSLPPYDICALSPSNRSLLLIHFILFFSCFSLFFSFRLSFLCSLDPFTPSSSIHPKLPFQPSSRSHLPASLLLFINNLMIEHNTHYHINSDTHEHSWLADIAQKKVTSKYFQEIMIIIIVIIIIITITLIIAQVALWSDMIFTTLSRFCFYHKHVI